MRHGSRVLVVVALAAIASCSDGSDGTTPSDPSGPPATVATSDASTDVGSDSDAETTVSTETTLTLADAAPDAATVSVSAPSFTEDRIIRRGAQAEIQQGQVFVVDDATSLESVSFEIVADTPVEPSELVDLSVYTVEDPTSAVPSGFVDLGAGDGPLSMPLGQPLPAGVPTYLTFSFPPVELEAGGHYAALLSLGDGASATVLYMQHADSDVYREGLAIRFEGSTWKADRVVGDQAFAVVLT